MEKEINKEYPQKVFFDTKINSNEIFPICPICEKKLIAEKRYNYCSNCGQKLDWSYN